MHENSPKYSFGNKVQLEKPLETPGWFKTYQLSNRINLSCYRTHHRTKICIFEKKKTKLSSYRKTFLQNKKSEIEVTVLGNVKQQLRLFINLFPVHQSAKVY
jgi:hypothetical protein